MIVSWNLHSISLCEKTLQLVLGSKMNEWMQIQNRGSKQRKVIGAENALQTKGIKVFFVKETVFLYAEE